MSQFLATLLTSASRKDLRHFSIRHSNYDRPHESWKREEETWQMWKGERTSCRRDGR